MFIVWTETTVGEIKAERKNTKLAAVRAYNKIMRNHSPLIRTYGWTISEDAEPRVRVAVGLTPFLALGVKDD